MSWQRLPNPAEGGPIPVAAIAIIVLHMIKDFQPYAAFVTLLAFDAYLRESDWEGLCGGDVFISSDPTPKVALMLGVGSRGLSTKTGSDHGVVLDDPFISAWAAWAAELRACTDDTAALVPFSQVEYRRIWSSAQYAHASSTAWEPLIGFVTRAPATTCFMAAERSRRSGDEAAGSPRRASNATPRRTS